MKELAPSNVDGAEQLKIVMEIPDGDYNREVEIEATTDGLRIDDYIVISWEWICLARETVGVLHEEL